MIAKICEKCGCELPEEAPEGLCPGCLLAGAIKLPAEAAGDLSRATEVDPSSPAMGMGEQEGDVIDRYRLVERIGEGGMGVVYRAEQTEPLRREVALKIIKLGMDTREVVARFETERQALALMDHPHIAHMFDAGATESGRPYFVMELVEGIPITEYCDRNKLKVRERLDLFHQVCEAIQHAHQKGVIHRDIKPSNVLVVLQDGGPIPKVIDFGVAKATQQRLTEKSLFTRSGQMVGTPEYMSPEQAEMSNLDVDTRSDVYSLGVLLYELLTGGPPFEATKLREAGLNEVCRIIRDVEPPKPSTRISTLGVGLHMVAERRSTGPKKLGGMVRGELDWVVMKCLEKDRTRRYETVSSLGADIRHFLSGEPVDAGPPTRFYKLNKLVRRHKRAIAAVALVFVSLVAGVITTSWQAVRATDAERQAQEDAVRATRAERHAKEDAAIAKAVNEFISRDLLSQANPWAEPDRDVKLREVLDRAAAKVGNRFKDQPLVEAAIRMTLGETYSGLGEYTTAETHTRRAVEIRKNVLGEEHPDTFDSLYNLAGDYWPQGPGRYPEAEEIYLKVLEIRKKVLGKEHPDTLGAQFSLATVYWLQGRYPEAEDLFLKVIEIQKRVLGEEHPRTLLSLGNLAGFYIKLGRYPEAEEIHLRVIESRKKVLGEEHPDTLGALNNLALVYNKQRRYPQAEEIYLKVVEIYKKVLGEEHPDTLSARHNLAMVYRSQGRSSEAEDLYLQVVEIGKKALSEEHPVTLSALNRLADIYWKQGPSRYPEAEEIYLKVVEIQKKVLGKEHPDTLGAQFSLATVYWLQGRYPEAEDMFLKVIEVQERVLGEEHPGTLSSLGNLALVYKDQGRYPEAEALDLKVIESRRKVLGEEHPDTLDTRHNLAVLYESQGRYPEAEALNLKVLEIRMRVLGEKNPDTLKSLFNLANGYIRQRRYPEAEEFFLKVVGIRQKVLGEEHPDTLGALNNLALIYESQGRYPQAEEIYLKVVEIYKKVLGEEHPDTLGARHNLAMVYSSQGRYPEAEDLYLKVLEIGEKVLGGEHPVTLSALNNLAILHSTQGRHDKAIECYTKAIQLKPDYYAGYCSRAEAYIMTGRHVEAADSLDECLPLANKNKDILVWNYLRAISASLLDQSTTKYESALASATKEDTGITWSFKEIENWLKGADVSAEKKQFIAQLTGKAKAKQKSRQPVKNDP